VLCTGDSDLQVVENLHFFFRGPPAAGTISVKSVLALAPKFHVSDADMAGISRQSQEFDWEGLPFDTYFVLCFITG